MMGPSHRIAGVAAWLGVADMTGAGVVPVAAGLVVAAATSHGRLSPDMDRYPLLGKVIPGGHRGITHWWPVPAVALLVLFTPCPWWLPAAVVTAWVSHIATDGVFGRVPVWRSGGKWLYRGLRLRTGGLVEKAVAVPVFIAAAGWLAYLITRRGG